ncbi:glutamyl-tRNA reductase [Chitinimonas sp. BJB300]|uniref:glutamyl-tRNA reductase n=1 Tax=Chitinimonas sp. BJB300 TaxID=1559339 RepID=UPI000C0E6E46|nr:glutamyl-tRNA reductase [Chitinimonas sp. BJB300]PHV12660.1 glutamyl-tRNA reductase [Chitinimonas sp. BJB300]TSJ91194.1 glutamyl-tRNA reductase [Chitinimonas sp. BJB300]
MSLFTLGLNYETAPISVREKLAFAQHELGPAVAELVAIHGIGEAAIISTCNRTELYATVKDETSLLSWLAKSRQLKSEEITPYLYRLPDRDAVRHVFRVAAGLDSMVLGETQILGQLKDAVREAQEAGGLGSSLNGLFQKAFSVAKEVRTDTAIGANSISMAAAAVKLAERLFPDIADLHVLFIGAGEMIELCATHFAARKPRRMTVANRTLERGQTLASRIGGDAFTLIELPNRLPQYDIVITSTASQLPILGLGAIERAIKVRKHRPIFMVDLAVPRDVENEVGALPDVYLYTVDDLAEVIRQGREERQQAVVEADVIIERHTEEFMQWLDNRALVPTIRALKDQAERLRRHELVRASKLLAKGENPAAVLESLSLSLSKKFLHAPLAALNQADAGQHGDLINAVRQLYHLHDEE